MYCFTIKKMKQERNKGRRHVLEWWLIVNSMASSKKIDFFMNTAEPLMPYMSVYAVASVATMAETLCCHLFIFSKSSEWLHHQGIEMVMPVTVPSAIC
jgi:hypothetical protein